MTKKELRDKLLGKLYKYKSKGFINKKQFTLTINEWIITGDAYDLNKLDEWLEENRKVMGE